MKTSKNISKNIILVGAIVVVASLSALYMANFGATGKNMTQRLASLSALLPMNSVNPIAYWKFDEGSGTVATDSSGNLLNGKIVGPVYSTGKYGNALSFDGLDDYATIKGAAAFDNLASMTISAWVKPTTTGEKGMGRIVSKAAGTNLPSMGWDFYLTNEVGNGIKFAVDHTTTDLEHASTANAITMNQWQFVAVTWDGSKTAANAHIYVNGNEVSYSVANNAVGTRASDTANAFLIGNNPALSRTFKGNIDDVRVYNRALSVSEIKDLYNNTGTIIPPVPDTTAPNIPTNLQALVLSSSQINLSWTASIDNVAVAGYNLYRNGTKITATTATSYSDISLTAGTTYSYAVSAYDAAGNTSAQTSAISAKTNDNQVSTWFKPAIGTPWQIQFSGTLDQTIPATVFDIDLFDTDASVIASLHSKGKKVVCYFSAGSYENWRPDASLFTSAVKGNSNGWAGENWIDIRNLTVLGPIMNARLDLAKSKGCDGIDADNMDAYTNTTGFPLTAADQLTYNKFIANSAHARGLGIGLKNDLDQVADLVGLYDWQINEECFDYNECNLLAPFITAGKEVMQIEYALATTKFCPQAISMNFDSIKKNLSLDAARTSCR